MRNTYIHTYTHTIYIFIYIALKACVLAGWALLYVSYIHAYITHQNCLCGFLRGNAENKPRTGVLNLCISDSELKLVFFDSGKKKSIIMQVLYIHNNATKTSNTNIGDTYWIYIRKTLHTVIGVGAGVGACHKNVNVSIWCHLWWFIVLNDV
jgi:hypothetical protein